MSKRFTDSEKWTDKWYRKLPTPMKLLWHFMLDKCDPAGIWDVDLELFEMFSGEAITEDDFYRAFGERILRLPEGKIWIVKFIQFQYGRLSEECKPHKPAISSLRKYSLFETYLKGIESLTVGYSNPTRKEQDQEKDKDKEKEGSAEGGSAPAPVPTFRVEARSQEAVALAAQARIASPAQPDYDRARQVAGLYPAKAKDGRPISFPLDAQNLLAVRIAKDRAYPWEEHARLVNSIPMPLDGQNWVNDMPNPVALEKLRKATKPAEKKEYFTA